MGVRHMEAVQRAGAPSPLDARWPIRREYLPVTGHQDLRMHGDQWLPILAPCCQVHGLAQGGHDAVSPHRDLGRMSLVQTLYHCLKLVALSPLPLYASPLSSVKRGRQRCPTHQIVREINRENTHEKDNTALGKSRGLIRTSYCHHSQRRLPGLLHASSWPWPWPRAAVGSLYNSIHSPRIMSPPCARPGGKAMDRTVETHWTHKCCFKQGAWTLLSEQRSLCQGYNSPKDLSTQKALLRSF